MADVATEVLVVGAGPVGAALALDLALRGRRVRLLEARRTRPPGSRAIGVHPPGLEALGRLGVADALLDAGTRVRRGRAVGATRDLGTLVFDGLPAPYRFVLTVPQPVTERVLLAAFERACPGGLEWGARVDRVVQGVAGVTLHGVDVDGAARSWSAAVGVGCDGRDGAVRRALGVGRRGGPYGDRFAMADLPDAGEGGLAGDEALVALHRSGVVEGFPLPGGVRRWVVRATPDDPAPDGAPGPEIARWVAQRVARRTDAAFWFDLVGGASVFEVERWLADRFAVGRVALAGDAAHVLSPIGGQGMNLGWLDGAALAAAIDDALDAEAAGAADAVALALARVGARRRAVGRRAIGRAFWNTALGRPHGAAAAAVRDAALARLLRPPWAAAAGRRFTMVGLR